MNDPVSRISRHHPVFTQANQCTSFASGLRPHPWRARNTYGASSHRRIRTTSFASDLRPHPWRARNTYGASGAQWWVGKVRFWVQKGMISAHRNGPFRPTTALNTPPVGIPGSSWMWAKARRERGVLIRLCGDGVVLNDTRNGVIHFARKSSSPSATLM
jgi:hypothetical protein